ncbi:MAG: hypothetical protein ACLFTR_04765 [Candidatus Woesearchaeota archaeon]
MSFRDKTKAIIFVALFLAIFFPQPATFIKDYLIFILIFMLSISIRNLGAEHLNIKKKELVGVLVFVNAFILSATYIAMSYLLISNELYRNALIIYSLMPPAIGIVSLGYIYHVDMKVDLYAEFIGYIVSLGIIPLGTHIFMRTAIAPIDVLEVIFFLLVIPMILSRIIRRIAIPDDTLKMIISTCFGFVIYTIVGFNLEMIMENLRDVLNITILLFILRIILMIAIFMIARRYLSHENSVLLTLFGTMKNGAAATAISLMLLGVESTVPLALEAIFFALGLFVMDYMFTWSRESQKKKA